jgi:hypothetical protein
MMFFCVSIEIISTFAQQKQCSGCSICRIFKKASKSELILLMKKQISNIALSRSTVGQSWLAVSFFFFFFFYFYATGPGLIM